MIFGRLKATPGDFVVEEIPLYEPSGSGEHVYVEFRKTNRTSDDAARAIGRALGVAPRDIGIAGMKDKVAITTQTISLLYRGTDAETKLVGIDGVEILKVSRHGNKLKTGHLSGNRFTIHVRDVPKEHAERACAELSALRGVPNAFGPQRFGRDNVSRALSWLRDGGSGPRDPRERRFLYSALQSEAFNRVLARRRADRTWDTPLLGDILQKHKTPLALGGLFECTDVATDQERAVHGEVSPTGPMFGPKMQSPKDTVAALEGEVLDALLGRDFQPDPRLGEGTRRVLRLLVPEVHATTLPDAIELHERHPGATILVRFVLPKGAFATTVLGEVFEIESPRPASEAEHDD